MTRFITVHMLHSLPMHNLNRDQNGAPKTCTDGGVQRARLSSQSIKRPARALLRAGGLDYSIRTRLGADIVVEKAKALAEQRGTELDEKAAKRTAHAIIRSLTNSSKADDKKADKAEDQDAAKDDGDNMLLFAQAELASLATAIVDQQAGGKDAMMDDFILDSRSSALDVAAFGRMFANDKDRGTIAAVSVSHATTTHAAQIMLDYFSAVEEAPQSHSGAGHIGMAYFTSGTYYRSFTINVDQLARSWSGLGQDGDREQIVALVKALILALPTGRDTNSAAKTLPFAVLAEEQGTRVSYGFEEPVQPGRDGGYGQTSLTALAAQRRRALAFDESLFGDAVAYVADGYDADLAANPVDGLDTIAEFVADKVLGEDRTEHEAT